MTVIENQTPSKKPRTRKPWRDWLVITATAAGAWSGLCWLVWELSR